MDMFFAGSLHDPSIVVGGLSQVIFPICEIHRIKND